MKKKWWSSLRTKIIAWSFVPAVIILSAVAWFTFYSYQRVIGDLAIKQDWAVVQSQTQPIYQAIASVNQPIFIQVVMSVDVRKDDPVEVRAQTTSAASAPRSRPAPVMTLEDYLQRRKTGGGS